MVHASRSFFAEVSIHAVPTEASTSFVRDKCQWEAMRAAYPNFRPGPELADWKRAALEGMQFAIRHVPHSPPKELHLRDIRAQYTDATLSTLFAAGLLAALDAVQVVLNEEDDKALKAFVFAHRMNRTWDMDVPALSFSTP